ncbi:low affinity immunoglobulin epsilon Fc receptor-like [Hypanus sabinus]|uniref:low affinity immunoglobulin epsilon Fc receptor-like n=1 Tax=Hypanus sabinus TaxID=79690 RepID=UPI0028C475ED|nr:low affinity immunoglobulin epsilon Fc receptor-like [Hypanus sabinus]
MDDSETYMNVNFTKTDSPSPSGAEPDVSYAELNVKMLTEPRVRIVGVGLNSTYSELNFRKEETRVDKDEDPPISSGHSRLSSSAQTGPHKQETNENIGNRRYRKICLLCLVTSVLVAIVAGLSIYVSQIRHSLITCDRGHQEIWEQYQELNRTQLQCRLQQDELNKTLESSITQNSRLALSRSTCLKDISVLNNNLSILENKLFVLENENSVLKTHLSDLNQIETNLRQKNSDLENQYRSLIKEKGQICQLLTSRKEQTCSQNWIRNKGRCYFISTVYVSYDEAKQHCSSFDSRLFEINSNDEAV